MRLRSILLAGALAAAAPPGFADDWAYYGRDAGGARSSPLTQITPANVGGLKVAWTYHTGDIANGKSGPRSGFETTPLVLDGRLYLTTGFNRVIALDPASGKQLWAFDPAINRRVGYGDGLINRGVAAWRNPRARGACALTLFEATLDARLIALDAATGKPCEGFGRAGEVSLKEVKNYRAGDYHMTSPPIVVDGVVVVGSAIDDNARLEMPGGVVRGFDARTGKLLWSWEPLARPEGVAPQTWRTGAANAWSILAADPARHLVFLPTGSASPDFFGGYRPGDNHWANSVVALDTRTGRLKWGFQLVHHDLWDFDTAPGPVAATVTLDGKARRVVIAANKTGMVFVLDEDTGKPILPVEERPVPQTDVPGEKTSPTQPFPATLPPLAPQSQAANQVFGITEADRKFCADALGKLSGASIFTPPSLAGELTIPGNVGGINWSGYALDARRGLLIAPVTNMPYRIRLIPADRLSSGADRGDFRAETAAQRGAPYGVTRAALRGPSGAPCIPPPWGELVALDLAKGKIAWRTPLGSMDELAPGIGQVAKGSAVLGGPIVTASGLVFQGGSIDRRFRAFDVATGKELWSAELPASAHATPITYQAGGKQYVVIAAGGSAKIEEEKQGDALVAFALP
ncbi:MAG TPA: pyrroloquinoline quinone-dependent dehydrogenase [Caulobacteraceae bacterium]|nr:pyrroloquinoline quinone-dependent dehydrogenase [Caulobacteraceae bacterium]